MRHNAVPKKRGNSCLGTVEELVGKDNVQWMKVFLEGSHGARRQDPLCSELFEAVNVGAEVQLGRQDRMIAIVPGQERNALPFKRPHAIGIRRWSERRIERDLLNVRKAFHLIEAAASNDSNPDVTFHVRQAPAILRAYPRDERTLFLSFLLLV